MIRSLEKPRVLRMPSSRLRSTRTDNWEAMASRIVKTPIATASRAIAVVLMALAWAAGLIAGVARYHQVRIQRLDLPDGLVLHGAVLDLHEDQVGIACEGDIGQLGGHQALGLLIGQVEVRLGGSDPRVDDPQDV